MSIWAKLFGSESSSDVGPRSEYWKCPKCGGILKKGFGNLPVGVKIVGTAKCGGCGAELNQADVYAGKFDVQLKKP
jgi:hypothetical protein